ncbi:hypothetical protein GCM10018952_15010 [Streptosporangium vulgare]
MLVIRTRPSGIMVTMPATVPVTASPTLVCLLTWLQVSRAPIGMTSQVTYLMNRVTPSRSSEWDRLNALASSASLAA